MTRKASAALDILYIWWVGGGDAGPQPASTTATLHHLRREEHPATIIPLSQQQLQQNLILNLCYPELNQGSVSMHIFVPFVAKIKARSHFTALTSLKQTYEYNEA